MENDSMEDIDEYGEDEMEESLEEE